MIHYGIDQDNSVLIAQVQQYISEIAFTHFM